MKTKDEWIKELTTHQNVVARFEIKINNKKHKVSSFYRFASKEHKQDKELNILNFAQNKNVFEIPEGMIDFEFIKGVFEVNESRTFFNLPYCWKNTTEEKDFLKKSLEIITDNSSYRSNNDNIQWMFETGFWSDISYTKKIRETEYYYLELAIVKELNLSEKQNEINYLLEIINEIPYYLQYIKSKHKNLLLEETILTYAKDYGIKSLTKKQKTTFNIVKEAFHNGRIPYDDLDNQWKKPEFLKQLLDSDNIWKSINSKNYMHINKLTPELLQDRELIKICLKKGSNFFTLKTLEETNNINYCQDKELKSIALKTYPDFNIIIDCLDDPVMVLDFLTNLQHNKIYSGINLFEQTKRIGEEMYQNKEIMEALLSIRKLDQKEFIAPNAINAIKTYPIGDIIDFVIINKEVYTILPDELKNKWEIILPYYEATKSEYHGFSKEITNEIRKMGASYEEKVTEIEKFALNENLSRNLTKTINNIKKIKI